MIYDNTYLFSKRKSIKFILRKEVEEILNGGIYLQQHEKEEEKEEEKKLEKKDRFELPEKKEFIKKKQMRKNLYTKSKYLREFLDEEKFQKLGEEDELTKQLKLQEKIKEENLEKKLNEFIYRIKNLKKGELMGLSNNGKIDDYINQRLKMDDNEKEKKEKENRINEFLTSLNDYRTLKKQQRKLNDTFIYKEPIMVENLMIDNYEENDISFGFSNIIGIKNQFLLKDIYKIKTHYSNKSYTKKNNNSYSKEKSYLTEVYY